MPYNGQLKKCGCRWLSFPNNEDGPAEAFWNLCEKHQAIADKTELPQGEERA